MPQQHKGVQIPASTDTADAVQAFKNLVDAGNVIHRTSSVTNATAGMIRWNSNKYEYYTGSAWVDLFRGSNGPRGFLGQQLENTSLVIPNQGAYTPLAMVTITGTTAGRRLKVTGHAIVACGATTDPSVDFGFTMPGALLTSSVNKRWPTSSVNTSPQSAGTPSGFFRTDVHITDVFTSTGSSQTFSLSCRVMAGNAWTRERAYILIEDIGPA
jgi:hypothetical protein